MDADFKIIKKLEFDISSREIRANSHSLSKLLHKNFEEIGKSGRRFSKAELLSEMPTWQHHEIKLTDMEFIRLSENTILLKYLSSSDGVKANRSSIWINGENGWQIIFHQGTKCE